MYRWDGTEYKRPLLKRIKTHAKEILVADVTGDNKAELFSVLEAERVGKAIGKPVEIRQYIGNLMEHLNTKQRLR